MDFVVGGWSISVTEYWPWFAGDWEVFASGKNDAMNTTEKRTANTTMKGCSRVQRISGDQLYPSQRTTFGCGAVAVGVVVEVPRELTQAAE